MKKWLAMLLAAAMMLGGASLAEDMDFLQFIPDMTIPSYEVETDETYHIPAAFSSDILTDEARAYVAYSGDFGIDYGAPKIEDGKIAINLNPPTQGTIRPGDWETPISLSAMTGTLFYLQYSVLYQETENDAYILCVPYTLDSGAAEEEFRGAILLYLKEDPDTGRLYRFARTENDDRILCDILEDQSDEASFSVLVKDQEITEEDAESSALAQYVHEAFFLKGEKPWPEFFYFQRAVPEN